MFLILFLTLYMTQRLGFPINRIGFIRCEGKCFLQQHAGIVVENSIPNDNFIITHDVLGG